MSSDADSAERDPDDLSFEEAAVELESIIERIESGSIGLEASLAARKRGELLLRRCRGVLDVAEQEIMQITQLDDGPGVNCTPLPSSPSSPSSPLSPLSPPSAAEPSGTEGD